MSQACQELDFPNIAGGKLSIQGTRVPLQQEYRIPTMGRSRKHRRICATQCVFNLAAPLVRSLRKDLPGHALTQFDTILVATSCMCRELSLLARSRNSRVQFHA